MTIDEAIKYLSPHDLTADGATICLVAGKMREAIGAIREALEPRPAASMTIDKTELRRLAEAATPDWWILDIGDITVYGPPRNGEPVIVADCGWEGAEHARANASYIRAAQPLNVLALLDELEAKERRIAELEGRDREAATYVESVICMRTHFTGDPPYVGWKGLGLALNETLDRNVAALAEKDRHIELLQEKIDAAGSCACAYDGPDDVCMTHSPHVNRLRLDLRKAKEDRKAAIWECDEAQKEQNLQYYELLNARRQLEDVETAIARARSEGRIDGMKSAAEVLRNYAGVTYEAAEEKYMRAAADAILAEVASEEAKLKEVGK